MINLPPIFVPELPIPTNPTIPTFELGLLVATPAALDALSRSAKTPLDIIRSHASGDAGDLEACDVRANVAAISSGTRVVSAYTVDAGGTQVRLLVITEAVGDDGHRASTCLLLRSEY
jgi:hypothetical protein